MREIKFMAWNTKAKEMAKWDLILKECDRMSLRTIEIIGNIHQNPELIKND